MTEISISPKAITRSLSFGKKLPPLAKRKCIYQKTDIAKLCESLGEDKYKNSEAIDVAFENRSHRENFLETQYKKSGISIRTHIDILREEKTRRKFNCLINNLRKIRNSKELSDKEKEMKSKQVFDNLLYYYKQSRPWWNVQFEFVVYIAKNFFQKSYVQ